jgi:hypothetical protein
MGMTAKLTSPLHVRRFSLQVMLILTCIVVNLWTLHLHFLHHVERGRAQSTLQRAELRHRSAESSSTVVLKPGVAMDIISAGSRTKLAHLEAQQATFGSHATVRHYYRFTEDDDVDQDCLGDPTAYNFVNESLRFCRTRADGESDMAHLFGTNLFAPRGGDGWLCAQKRPLDGFQRVMQLYRKGVPIPPYLAIIDDDTYLNMDLLLELLLAKFPPNEPHVLAGFNLDFIEKYEYTFPVGGYGSFLSQAAIERLLKPIDCSAKDPDPFTRLNCWRLSLNYVGEANIFRDGMSISDLMFRYSIVSPFSNVSSWKSGFCMHSDEALGYFFNFYHIAVPDQAMIGDASLNDDLLKRYRFAYLTPDNNGTSERRFCSPENHVCHYTTPDQMHALYRYSQIYQMAETTSVSTLSKVLDLLDAVNASAHGDGSKNWQPG